MTLAELIAADAPAAAAVPAGAPVTPAQETPMTPPPAVRTRIPFTVLGGFLGAGKTTLLNRLLTEANGRRWGVLVNDFGALNIDAELVASRDARTMKLSNGCVCCQIGGDLADGLAQLLTADEPPDAIVVEASGVADPGRIAQVARFDAQLRPEGVIVLVDASRLAEEAADPLLTDTLARQVRAADLLLLNHADRADAMALAAAERLLDTWAPATPRCLTRQAELPAPWQLALSGPVDADTPEALRALAACNEPRPVDEALATDPEHGQVFETWSWLQARPLSADALRALLKCMPPGVMRLKGHVKTDRHARALLQYAGRHGSLIEWPAEAAGGTGIGRLVAIGLRGHLPVAALEAALASASLPA